MSRVQALREAGDRPGAAWGCEREQGAGSTGEAGGGDRRESLADTGKDPVGCDYVAIAWRAAKPWLSGGDRRRPQAADSWARWSSSALRRRLA